MKQVQLILFLLIGAAFSSFIGIKDQIEKSDLKSSLIFVGYQDSFPVFNASKEKKIYIFKNEFILSQEYDSKRTLLLVQNRLYLYELENEEGYWIIVVRNGKEEKYKVKSSIAYYATNGEEVYFTDYETKAIQVISQKGIKTFGVKGYVAGYSQGCLYYSKEHDPNLIHANADIFRIDVQQPSTPEKIMTNVSGEATYILPDGKHIFEKISHEGEFKPIIYSIEKKKYKIIQVDEKFFVNVSTPFYSYQNGQLVFYNCKTLEMLHISIPTEFDLIR